MFTLSIKLKQPNKKRIHIRKCEQSFIGHDPGSRGLFSKYNTRAHGSMKLPKREPSTELSGIRK